MTEDHGREGPRPMTAGIAGVLAALGGALAWAMWLSWPGSDHTYHPAQVVACALTCAVVAVLLTGRSTRAAFLTVPLGATIGVAIPWAWWAARSDETGLWLVGLLMLAVGVWIGLSLAVVLADIVRRRRWR